MSTDIQKNLSSLQNLRASLGFNEAPNGNLSWFSVRHIILENFSFNSVLVEDSTTKHLSKDLFVPHHAGSTKECCQHHEEFN